MSNFKTSPGVKPEEAVKKIGEDVYSIPGRYRDSSVIEMSAENWSEYGATQDVAISGHKLKEVGDPIDPQDGVNKGYVDNAVTVAISGVSVEPMTRVLYVNNDSTSAEEDGSIQSPFKAIQDALDFIGIPVDNAGNREHWTIFIHPGFYDEDLVVPESRIIALIGLGFWVLGDGASQYFNSSTTPRNITINLNANTEFGSNPRPSFMIGSTCTPECSSTHTTYSFGCIVSGDISWDVPAGALGSTTHEFQLHGARVVGSIFNPAGMGICNMYIEKSRVGDGTTAIQGISTNIVKAESTRFSGSLDLTSISRIDRCRLDGNVTTISIASYLPPSGFICCVFSAITFSGPAGSFRVDAYSNYSAKNAPIILAGGATKVILGDLTP